MLQGFIGVLLAYVGVYSFTQNELVGIQGFG